MKLVRHAVAALAVLLLSSHLGWAGSPNGPAPLVGRWTWFNDGVLEFAPNGHARLSSPALNMEGEWAQAPHQGGKGDRYIANWQNGLWITTIHLSADHRHFHAQNQYGVAVESDRLPDPKKTIASAPARSPRPAAPKSGLDATSPSQAGRDGEADPIVGRWSWFEGAVVVLRENGSAKMTSPVLNFEGEWKFDPRAASTVERGYVISWQNGFSVDTLHLSSDHRELYGQNRVGFRVSANRISGPETEPEPAPPGSTGPPRPEVPDQPRETRDDEEKTSTRGPAVGATVLPKKAVVISSPSEADSSLGNIEVTFSDGHREVLTTQGKCDLPHVSPSGDVGWNRPDKLTDDRYGRNGDILHLRLHDGSVKEFKPNLLFIMEWGFARSDSEVVIKSMGHHGAADFIKYDIKSGRVTGEVQGYHPKAQMPKWAQPYAD